MFQIYLSITIKEVGGCKDVTERCSKGLIQNNLSQNSFQSMCFVFFIVNTCNDMIGINVFPIYLSIAIKEVGGGKDRLRRGAPRP